MEIQARSKGEKPIVIGLYGVPGCGKTTLLNELQSRIQHGRFKFYESSDVIDTVTPGGLQKFKNMTLPEKLCHREQAIIKIREECVNNDSAAVVAGHCMFWSEDDEDGEWVVTNADWTVYSHIVYVDVPAETVLQRRQKDTARARESVTLAHIDKWQSKEKKRLRDECYQHGVLLTILHQNDYGMNLLDHVSKLLRDFTDHTEERNFLRVETRLAEIVGSRELGTMLVVDGDRTLTAEDTGALFWSIAAYIDQSGKQDDPLKTLFKSQLQYTYTAFRQAMLLNEDVAYESGDGTFDRLCETVASKVTVRTAFRDLLQTTLRHEHVGAIVVTCGQRLIWEKVLAKLGLSDRVQVIGGGRVSDGYVVTAAVKSAVVDRLRYHHQMYVWAFGDSLLDIPMLKSAQKAVVVVGEEHNRSISMDAELLVAIKNGGLRACQLLVPASVTPRLDTDLLPLFQLTGAEIQQICRDRRTELQLHHATDGPSARLLTTATRDSTISGPVLRAAHARVGFYLATTFVAKVIGLEEYGIPHVQNRRTLGHRLRHEKEGTMIVPLMRGGEPMALGVSDAFPQATFKHANNPQDLTASYLRGLSTIILVDSVVNEGTTIKKFVEHIRSLHTTVHIVIVANVVQAKSVSKDGLLRQLAREYGRLSLVALRLSDNKYTGRGTTDTGNRLFNTTHLEK